MDKEQATCELGKAIGELTGKLICDFICYALDTTNAKALKEAKEELIALENDRINTIEKIAYLRWYQIFKRYDLRCHLNAVNGDIHYLKERIAHLEQIVPEKMK